MNLIEEYNIKTNQLTLEKVELKMTVTEKQLQPFGIMHGGINAVLIETAASIGGNYQVKDTNKIAFGVDIQVNHLASAKKDDLLTITATPNHVGRTTQVWQGEIFNQDNRLISVGRCTLLTQQVEPKK